MAIVKPLSIIWGEDMMAPLTGEVIPSSDVLTEEFVRSAELNLEDAQLFSCRYLDMRDSSLQAGHQSA
jgi:hypothetical protein